MKRFRAIAGFSFMEPIRHRVMFMIILAAYLLLLIGTYLWFNNLLGEGEISAYRTYVEMEQFNMILFKYITIFMIFLFAPLFRHESLHHYSDLILYRPIPRPAYYLARILGRSLYYPIFSGGIFTLIAILFMVKGVSLEFIWGFLIQILLFQYLQVLIMGAFLCLLSTIATFWWFHVIYFAGFWMMYQQLDFALKNHTLPFGEFAVKGFLILLTAIMKGAPVFWFSTFSLGPYHCLRLTVSLVFALSFNFVLGAWLFNKMDL